MGYVSIFLSILFTVYGQLIFKWRMGMKGPLPPGLTGKFSYIIHAYFDFWIITAFISAFLASAAWSVALTKFPLSFAYPFTSLSFVFVFLFSILLFHEQFTWDKLVGMGLIIVGLLVLANGKSFS